MSDIAPVSADTLFEPVPEEQFAQVWQDPPGIMGILRGVQNTPIGIRFIVTAFFFFCVAGILALLMRVQLAFPQNTFLDPEAYNRFMTMHGTTMMFLVTVPLIEGVATLVLPQMLGSRELPFPRLSAFSYWTFVGGGILFYASFLLDAVPDGGWFAYVPLTNKEYSPGFGIDFWLLGLNVAEISAIAGAIEIIIAFFKLRAPGMSLNRVPVFAWAMMITAWMMIFAFTPLIVGSTLLELDRAIGTRFFDPDFGGDPLLWQHVFWVFGHPDVYIMFVPSVGMVSVIVPVFARRALIGYIPIVVSLVAISFLSFGLWVHHMFTTGLPELGLAFFTAASMMIAIPSGIQVFAWIATLGFGKPVFKTPLWFVIGFLLIFVIGGLTGVMLAAVPFNLQAHDSHFVVAHFHYVLLGGWLFPVFAGIYYWFPKFAERMLNEKLGILHCITLFIGVNLTFFPMHISGLLGMPRRVYTFMPGLGLEPYNLLSSIGAFVLGFSILIFIINVIWSWKRGERAPANPWGADTLEWATPTPIPDYGFRTIPITHSRHPIWETAEPPTPDGHSVAVVTALAQYPREYRAQLVTTTLDARPEEVFRVSGSSIFPFLAAMGLSAMSFFLVISWYVWALVTLILTGLTLIGWFWDAGDHSNPAEERAFERELSIPLRSAGSRAVARWGALLTITTLATAFVTLVFSYFYLRLKPPQWPPAGVAIPDSVLAGIGVGVLLLSMIPMVMASRAVYQQRLGVLRGGLIAVTFLGTAYLALTIWDYARIGVAHYSHAFGSLFLIFSLVQWVTTIAGLLMCVITVGRILRRGIPENTAHLPYQSTTDIAYYWGYTVVVGILTYGLFYLLPYVI